MTFAGVIEDVEEIAILVLRILTQMVERTVDVPQILTVQQPVPQVTTQTVARPYHGRSNAAGRDSGSIQASSSASDEIR